MEARWRPGKGQVEIQRPGGQVEATNRYLPHEPHLGRVYCAAGGRLLFYNCKTQPSKQASKASKQASKLANWLGLAL